MEADAGVHARDEKLVGPERGDERRAVDVLRPRRPPAVVLRKAERDGRLPVAEVELLLRLSRRLRPRS